MVTEFKAMVLHAEMLNVVPQGGSSSLLKFISKQMMNTIFTFNSSFFVCVDY